MCTWAPISMCPKTSYSTHGDWFHSLPQPISRKNGVSVYMSPATFFTGHQTPNYNIMMLELYKFFGTKLPPTLLGHVPLDPLQSNQLVMHKWIQFPVTGYGCLSLISKVQHSCCKSSFTRDTKWPTTRSGMVLWLSWTWLTASITLLSFDAEHEEPLYEDKVIVEPYNNINDGMKKEATTMHLV